MPNELLPEGTLSLMQMAKVSVAVEGLKRRRLPFISVCKDPTYGGVSASYAMQGDIKIGVSGARIGFAGPCTHRSICPRSHVPNLILFLAVILNTVYNMNQTKYDEECPRGFQTAEYLRDHGQLDVIVPEESALLYQRFVFCLYGTNTIIYFFLNPDDVEPMVAGILQILYGKRKEAETSTHTTEESDPQAMSKVDEEEETNARPHDDFTESRKIDRFTAPQVIDKVFTKYVELYGDGRIGSDATMKGGIALLNDQPCVVISTFKGPEHNWGMPSPHGYRLVRNTLFVCYSKSANETMMTICCCCCCCSCSCSCSGSAIDGVG